MDTKRAVQKRELMAEHLRERFSPTGGGQVSGARGTEVEDVALDYLLILLRRAAEREVKHKVPMSYKSEKASYDKNQMS